MAMHRLFQWFRVSRLPVRSGRAQGVLALLVMSLAATGAPASPSLLHDRHDFDTRSMLRPGAQAAANGASFSLASASRFSSTQSYSLMAMTGPGGSMSSGLYLNTLSYRFTPQLTASVDLGFHTPLHSSLPGPEPETGLGSVVLPRMGIEYRPSDRLSVNLELYNGPDAFKAYGGLPGPHSHRGNRVP